MNNIKIFVATHKIYDFPEENLYIPIQVGCALKEENFGYAKDNDSVDNISDKNASFCELTALYEVWKNNSYQDVQYIGLSHYRRYFAGHNLVFKNKKILNKKEALELLKKYDVVVPKQRNYFIENVYEHYKNAHYENDLIKVEKIIMEKYPKYIESFHKVMRSKKLHLYNMFIMKKEMFDEYMEWLFDILFELEKNVNISEYDSYQARVFGFMSERLFNVWLVEQNVSKYELKVINIEGENTIQKLYNFLKRKFLKNKA